MIGSAPILRWRRRPHTGPVDHAVVDLDVTEHSFAAVVKAEWPRGGIRIPGPKPSVIDATAKDCRRQTDKAVLAAERLVVDDVAADLADNLATDVTVDDEIKVGDEHRHEIAQLLDIYVVRDLWCLPQPHADPVSLAASPRLLHTPLQFSRSPPAHVRRLRCGRLPYKRRGLSGS